MKEKFLALFASLGFAPSAAQSKAEKAELTEADADQLIQAIKDRDSFKTQLDAAHASELSLQGKLDAEIERTADLTGKLNTATTAKTNVETELGVAKQALEGKVKNPYAENTDPASGGESVSIQHPGGQTEFVTVY